MTLKSGIAIQPTTLAEASVMLAEKDAVIADLQAQVDATAPKLPVPVEIRGVFMEALMSADGMLVEGPRPCETPGTPNDYDERARAEELSITRWDDGTFDAQIDGGKMTGMVKRG